MGWSCRYNDKQAGRGYGYGQIREYKKESSDAVPISLRKNRWAGNNQKEKDWYLLDLPPADRFRPLRRNQADLLQ